ncbi:hypothetical protein GMORB2_1224 [Geosmithia morbida]|uniref:Uncharacterized protein n=1 Tax=Geosmithia morbida TaxID=1094350 RepID=A0A9P4YZL0_9HYPO|nr:uncharacterized protein GMORB2_1224 [Geosmithia morbida]KAF4125978.1 hypothetical protein GMORB2_1224 [Geosmithia morbida]
MANIRTLAILPQPLGTPSLVKKRGISPSAALSSPKSTFGFNLRDEKLHILNNKSVRNLLFSIFPNTTEIGEDRARPFLHFTVNELPAEPWPLTVGGIPITLSTCTAGQGFPFSTKVSRRGNTSISIGQTLDGRNGALSSEDLRTVTAELLAYINGNHLKTDLVEVMFASDRFFYVVLGNDTDMSVARSRLPGKLAKCITGYIFDHEVNRPGWARQKSRRETLPQPFRGTKDDIAYYALRPGVMISSTNYMIHTHSVDVSTTSGVMVKNASGQRFMTAASRDIGEDGAILQTFPGDWKKPLGSAVQEICFTDVAFVQLNDDVLFSNELFENDSGVTNQMTTILGENEGNGIDLDEMVFIDSPFTGEMEGTIMMKLAKLERDTSFHATDASLSYIVYI